MLNVESSFEFQGLSEASIFEALNYINMDHPIAKEVARLITAYVAYMERFAERPEAMRYVPRWPIESVAVRLLNTAAIARPKRGFAFDFFAELGFCGAGESIGEWAGGQDTGRSGSSFSDIAPDFVIAKGIILGRRIAENMSRPRSKASRPSAFLRESFICDGSFLKICLTTNIV